MRQRTVLAVGVVVVVFVSYVGAWQQAGDANNLERLEDYLRYAALDNAALKAAFERWSAAIEQIPQAKSLPDPKFTYGYFIREVETRVGPQRQKFDIMQTFPWFGVIKARTDQASANAKAAQREARAQLMKTTQEKIQLENTLGTKAQQLLYEFEDTARKIRLYRNIVIPKTKEMVQASETAYPAAAIDFLSLLDAQDKLLKYELLYERAVAQNAQKLAKLERLAGTSLPTVDSDADSQKDREKKPQKESSAK